MPLLAIGLGLGAAGTAVSAIGNNQSQQAVKGVREGSMLRQQELQQQAANRFQQSAGQAAPQATQQNMAKGIAQRIASAQELQQAATGPDLPAPAQQSYAVTNGGGGRAGAATAAWANAVNGAAAKLGGYDDNATTHGIQQQQAGDALGVISNKSRGEAAVLPGAMEAASHRGDKISGWGSIVSALGNVASTGAATGAFKGWGGTAPTNSVGILPDGYTF